MSFNILSWNFTIYSHAIFILIYYGYLLSGVFFVNNFILGTLVSAIILFSCLTLHELAHGITARFLGYKVSDVYYHLLGAAVIIPEPKTEKDELIISSAGPLSNILLGIFTIYPLDILFNSFGDTFGTKTLIAWISLNIVLGVFNLLPLFPMDGGRILRSTLGFFLRRNVAYRLTYQVGIFTGVCLAFYSFVVFNIFGILIGAGLAYFNYNELKE